MPEDNSPVAEFQSQVENLRRQLHRERSLTSQLLHLANSASDLRALMRKATVLLQEWSGCDSVGIRLREGEDFPYFETRGFPPEFVQAENSLCVRDLDGQLVRDFRGNPVLECMCGNVLCGRFHPDLPFFTPLGSFWTNSTTALLASTTEEDRQARTRNRCNGEGYESVALIPLRSSGTTFGLIQLNDRRAARFTAELITLLETLAAALAEAIARRFATDEADEAALRQGMAVRAANVGLWDWDLTTDRVAYSVEWKRQIGYRENEISDSFEEWQNRVHPDDLGPVLAKIRAFIAEKRPSYRAEFRLRHKDGSYRWIMTDASVLVDDAGQPVRVMGSHIDITDRKQMEMALEASESLLARAEEIAGIGSFVWDLNGDTVILSKNLLRITGLTPEDLVRTREDVIANAVHPEDRARVSEALSSMIAAKRSWPLEFRLLRPDGEVRFVRSAGLFLTDDQGNLTRRVGVVQDLTEAKRAEASRRHTEERLAELEGQLRHATRLATLGTLAAGIAHEVNQPLCAILNFAQACKNLASQGSPDPSLICQWSEAIAAAASRSGEIVRRMTEFAGRSHGQYRKVSVRELLEEAAMLVRFEAKRRNVQILPQVHDEGLRIAVHPVQIHQVLVNLLRNAIEAFQDEGPVSRQVIVQVDATAEGIRVSVADNGPGLGELDPKELFAPFFTTKPTGLGMGLPISRAIVEEYRGRIWAARNEEGGLTVAFILPAECQSFARDAEPDGIRG